MLQYIKDFWYFIKFILAQDISLFFYRKYFINFIEEELLQLEGEIEFLNVSAYSIGYDYRYRKGLSIQLNDKLYALQCPYCKKEKLKWINWYESKEQNTPLLMICESCKIVLDTDLVNIGRRIV